MKLSTQTGPVVNNHPKLPNPKQDKVFTSHPPIKPAVKEVKKKS